MDNKRKRQRLGLITISISIVVFLVVFLTDVFEFDHEVNKMSQETLAIENEQLAGRIAYNVEKNKKIVYELAQYYDEEADFEKLRGVSESLGFKEISLVDKDMATSADLTKANVKIYNNTEFVYYTGIYRDHGLLKILVARSEFKDFYPLEEKKEYYLDGSLIIVDKNTQEILLHINGEEADISEAEIAAFLRDMDGSESYVYAANDIAGVNWTQITLKYNGSDLALFTRHIKRFVNYGLVELLIFGLLLVLIARSIKRKRGEYYIDNVTDGLNRQGFIVKAKKIVGHNVDAYQIVVLNICDFRKLNNHWGEEVGNDVLRFVDKKISEFISSDELVGRLSADYFAILMKINNTEKTIDRVQDIITRINREILVINREILVNDDYELAFWVGVCCLRLEKDIAKAASNSVFAAKYAIKRNVCAFYDQTMAIKRNEEYEIIKCFNESIKNNYFKIYLQPKVAQDGKCRAEALVRWEHPLLGFIKPNNYITIFEKSGKIYELDKYVFEEVCKVIAKWKQNNQEVVEISVNVSRYSLKEAKTKIFEEYGNIKDKYGIEDGMIEIEITETDNINLTEMDYIKHVILGFRLKGFKVSLDDFGVAYSSLYILKEFQIDTIKLDRSFFVDETVKSRTIVDYVIRLAHTLGISVVAEGIEEMEQVETLWNWGCDYIQGYVFSKPLSITEFDTWRDKK